MSDKDQENLGKGGGRAQVVANLWKPKTKKLVLPREPDE